jgi:DNA replication protein DnaC
MYHLSYRTKAPERYKDASMARVLYNIKIMEAMKKWLNLNKYFLIVSGCPGSGKTYLAWAIHHYWEEKYEKFKNFILNKAPKDIDGNFLSKPFIIPLSLRHYEENDFLSEIRSRMMGGSDYQYVINILCEADYFILDDFGTSQLTEWQKEVFFNFVNERMKTTLPTVIISNLSEKDIKKTYGPRVSTRLFAAENTLIDVGDTNLREIFNQEFGGKFYGGSQGNEEAFQAFSPKEEKQ